MEKGLYVDLTWYKKMIEILNFSDKDWKILHKNLERVKKSRSIVLDPD